MDFVPPRLRAPVAIGAYSICSATMLLFNKLAMYYVPIPSFVTVIQLLFAVVAVYSLQISQLIPVDPIEGSKVKAYSVYTVAFVLGVYCNMRALENSNVETVIIFRSCTPLAVAICDSIFLGRELPSRRSTLALCTIAVGAMMYVKSDSQFQLAGMAAYSWVVLYFFMICFEMTYGKKITSGIRFNSMWGPVLYTNLLSVTPMFALGLLMGDYSKLGDKGLQSIDWSSAAVSMLVISSIIGTLIGYTGWSCRSLVSATSFTLVGVLNKFITILLNVLIWDKHASPSGIFALVICLGGGAFYQQAPLRSGVNAPGRDAKMSKDYVADDSLKNGPNGSVEAVPLMVVMNSIKQAPLAVKNVEAV